jgi:hypothetical protein
MVMMVGRGEAPWIHASPTTSAIPSEFQGDPSDLDPKRLEVRFNPYEVAPYAFGAPSFAIDAAPLVDAMPAGAARRALFGR